MSEGGPEAAGPDGAAAGGGDGAAGGGAAGRGDGTDSAAGGGVLSDTVRAQLSSVSTATLAGRLQRRGFRNAFLGGLVPLRPGRRMVGVAHTLRYVPERPDLAKLLGFNAQRVAVESVRAGEVLVIEARGERHAGTIGDIFATRARQLGCVGVVTDGSLRDTPAIADLGLAVYHRASHGATLGRLHTPLDHQVPIACAGVTVLPGDVVVGDDEGAVVIAAALAAEVAAEAVATEQREDFALERVRQGASTEGYFPLSEQNEPEFERWLAQREGSA